MANEAYFRREIYALLAWCGFWPESTRNLQFVRCHRCKARIEFRPPRGRPDITCLNPAGRSAVVEVKMFTDGRLPKDKLTPQQRRWLTTWENDGGLALLAVGTRERPRRAFLFPWMYWLGLEQRSSNPKSVPIRDIIDGSRYELRWRGSNAFPRWMPLLDHSLLAVTTTGHKSRAQWTELWNTLLSGRNP